MAIRQRIKEALRGPLRGVAQEVVRGLAGVLAERMRDGVDPSGLPRTEPVSRQGTAGLRDSNLDVTGPKQTPSAAAEQKVPPSRPVTQAQEVPRSPLPAFVRVRVRGRMEPASIYQVPTVPEEDYTVLFLNEAGQTWLEHVARPLLEPLS